MIRKRFVLLASCLLQVSIFSQADTFKAPLVEKSLLLDAASKQFSVVVGERGHVLVSAAQSSEYEQVSLPLATTLTSVDIASDGIFVAGHDATIMYTPDKGSTWTIQLNEPELERPILDILFFTPQEGIAVGAYGLFYRTTNGGESWQSEQHATLLNPLDIEYLEEIRAEDEAFYVQELNSILPHINRVYEFNNKVYAAGEMGLLAWSDDRGRSWNRYPLDYAGSFFDIHPMSDDFKIAAGLRGAVYVLNEDGQWRSVNSCTTATLNSIVEVNKNELLIVGNNGAILSVDVPKLRTNLNASCGDNGVEYQQLNTKSAIATVVTNNQQFIAVTADGLQPLNLK